MSTPLDWLRRLRARKPASAPSGSHEVIVDDEHNHAVWPADHSLPPNWRRVGKSGSEAELKAYVQELLVETSPAPLLSTHRRDGSDDGWRRR